MLKKYSIVNYVLLIIIAILGVLLSVCPFNVPASTDRYNGFIGAIEKGIDVNGGVSAIYSAELKDSQSDLTDSIDSSISQIIDAFEHNSNYPELYVTRQGDKVRIEVSSTQSTDTTLDYLASPREVFITLDEVSDTLTNPEVFLNSDDISYAYVGYDYDNSAYTVNLEFTSIGKEKLARMLTSAENVGKETAYIYIDEVNSDNSLGQITLTDAEDVLVFTSTNSSFSSSNNMQTAQLAYNITSGALNVNLILLEKSNISPALGKNTLLFIGIACIITIVLTFAFLIVRYGHLGLLGSLSLVFYLVLFAFFMQAIPFILLNLSAVFGCIFAFLLATVANTIIFEKIREEYAIGKKIHLSFKGGLKKSLWPILDSHIVVILASALIWIFAPSALKGFAICLMLGAIVSIFVSLVITRYLLNIYLPLNSTKAKKLHLYRDKNVKEIATEEVVIEEGNSDGVVTDTANGGNNNE